MDDMDQAVTAVAAKMALPSWLYNFIRKVPIPAWQNIAQAEDRLLEVRS
jgi:hypothetical protein